MSESRRVQRVEKELREIISTYVVRKFGDQLISVSGVRASKDFRQAKVYVSCIGQSEVTSEQIEMLQEESVSIQREISKNIRMKYCPKLRFYNDNSIELSTTVNKILSEIDADD